MVAITKTPTVTDFKNNLDIYFEQAQATQEPVVVTGNEAKFVVLNAGAYQALLDRIELLDSVAGLYRAELDFAHGRSRPAREALEELGRQHGILP